MIKKIIKSYKNNQFINWLGIEERNRRVPYQVYGKVIRLIPSKVIKMAFIIDTIIPMTFFIPVMIAYLFKFITRNKGIMIEINNH